MVTLRPDRKERSLAAKAQDEAVATSVLRALSDIDREVIFQLYVQQRPESDIERDLGLATGRVKEIKSSVKASFFAERKTVAA